MSCRQIVTLAFATLLAPALLSCGGGGGPVTGENGVDPSDTGQTRAYERANPGAEDLLDPWNDPERLQSAFGLSTVTNEAAPQAVIANLIANAGGSSAGTGTMLRNVRAGDIEIIGERDGITYGQWKGGPAGTLDIEFDWRFAENVSTAARARMERAGKSWSQRILDEYMTQMVATGEMIKFEDIEGPLGEIEKTLDEDITTDGVLIFVVDQGTASENFSWARLLYAESAPDDLQPWLGSILLSRQHHEDVYVMAHEIGHVLGIFPGIGYDFQSFERYVDATGENFLGPKSVQINDGDPVPFQWVNENYEEVAPGTPGAMVDDGHPGVCTSIMAYCSADTLEAPSELDFAMLDDLGYDILDEATASEPELYGYGAWGRYGAWGVGVERTLSGSGDSLRAGADAFGMSPTTNLADSTVLMDEVRWTGSLLGVDIGHAALPPVFGDAELSVHLAKLTGTADFDNLIVDEDEDGEFDAFRMSSLSYDISVSGNGFSDADGRVAGGFYGPAHEEMAGVLDDRRQSVNLLAGFGGTQ